MEIKPFNPLLPDHPLVRDRWLCLLCELQFKADDIVTLVPMQQPTQPAANIQAIPVHWACWITRRARK